MKTLKVLRQKAQLTQQQAAGLVGISLRSYKSYENDDAKQGTLKYNYIAEKLEEYGKVDEEHGILTISEIQKICTDVLQNYDVLFCYLFGSYAKGYATETSDIDLLVSSSLSGLNYFEMVENLREALGKRVDVLDTKQLINNLALTEEILKDGVKIYEQQKERSLLHQQN